MSIKSMPLIGKSAKFRRAARRLIFELASSEAPVAEVVDWDSSLEAFSTFCESTVEAACLCGVVIVKRKKRKRRRTSGR